MPPTMINNITVPSSQHEGDETIVDISNLQCDTPVKKKRRKNAFTHDVSCDSEFVDGASTGTSDASCTESGDDCHSESCMDDEDEETSRTIQKTNRSNKKSQEQTDVKKLREKLKSVKSHSEAELKEVRKELKQALSDYKKEQAEFQKSNNNLKSKFRKLTEQIKEQKWRYETLKLTENAYKKEAIRCTKLEEKRKYVLKRKLNAYQKRISSTTIDSLEDFQIQLDARKEELQSARKHLDETKREQSKLERENVKLEKKVSILEKQIRNYNEKKCLHEGQKKDKQLEILKLERRQKEAEIKIHLRAVVALEESKTKALKERLDLKEKIRKKKCRDNRHKKQGKIANAKKRMDTAGRMYSNVGASSQHSQQLRTQNLMEMEAPEIESIAETNQQGGSFQSGREFSTEKKIECEGTYRYLCSKNGGPPSISAFAREIKVSRGFARKLMKEIQTWGHVVSVETLKKERKEENQHVRGVGAFSLPPHAKQILLDLQRADPSRSNIAYVAMLHQMTGISVSVSLVSKFFRHITNK